jgi:hypothetical protein
LDALRVELAHAKMEIHLLHAELQSVNDSHDGFLTRKQLGDLLFVLHPDTGPNAPKDRRDAAWHVLTRYQRLMLKQADRPALKRGQRITLEELAALKRQATAARKAKRATAKPGKRSQPAPKAMK